MPTPGSTPARCVLEVLAAGATTGVTELPHRATGQALDFAFAPDVPTAPRLPRRSPAESALAQALVGVPGVTLGEGGRIAIDIDALDADAPVFTDLASEPFGGYRAFLKRLQVRRHAGPVHWELIGPISVGLALRRAGAEPDVAFQVALRAVRARLIALAAAFRDAAPGSSQLIVLDEPSAAELGRRDFPLAPGEATDLLSAAMAAVEPIGTVGVRARAGTDVALLLEAGPRVIALPVTSDLVAYAGYLDRFLERGGWVAWGVVATEGPIADTPTRAWHRVSSLWCELVQRGCDAKVLRRQCLFTTDGGLAAHAPAVAVQITATVADVARLVRAEAGAARFVLGA